MAEMTPLGFQKPAGDDLIRQGDNVISANAQTADNLIANLIARMGITEDSEAAQTARLSSVEFANALQEAALTAHAARLANLDNAAGFTGNPLTLNDAAVKAAVTAGATTKAALDTAYAPDAGGKPVGKGELVYNIKDWGVVPSSGVDVTSLINTAAAAVYAVNQYARLYFPPGNYKITSTVRLRCGIDATNATFQYYGTGTAVIVGSDAAPNTTTVRQTYRLPRVINMSRGSVYWDGTSIGIKTVNLNTCEVYTPFIQDFSQGLCVYGYSGGNAYNTYFLGALWQNQKNLVLDSDAAGYSNQNLFLGGRLEHTATKGASIDDPDACQIYMATSYGGGPNNNTFVNVSMEGANTGYYRLDISGKYNHFYNCRWEAPAGVTPRIRWRATSQWNIVHGGYNTQSIVETFDGTLGGGVIYDYLGGYTKALTSAGQVIPTGTWTKVDSWAAPTQRRITYDNAGNFTPRPGRWMVSATVTFASNTTGKRTARLVCKGAVVSIARAVDDSTMKLDGTELFNGKTDTFYVEVQQTSGANLALEATAPFVKIEANYLGV